MGRYTGWVLMAGLVCCTALYAADPSGVWLDVPFVKQQKNGCGAASVAMVMEYWRRQQGKPESEHEAAAAIQRALYSAPAHGIYASDLEHYLKQAGFRTFALPGKWEDLKEELEKGRPLIVALKARGPVHYVVVTGLDWQQGVVLKNDPAERKLLKQDRSSFEKEWHAAANWMLLAVPQEAGGSSSP